MAEIKTMAGITNCVLIGEHAGEELPDGTDKVVIIGDNIKNLDHNQEDVIFLGNYVAIGKTICGIPINLYDILKGAMA